MDFVAIKQSWSKPCVSVFEVKVSRQDFLNDDKWPRYLDCSHKFYFACPSGLIKKDELAPGVGLVELGSKGLHWSKAAVYRPTDIPAKFWQHIVYSKVASDICPEHKRTFNIQHYQKVLENMKEGKAPGKSLSITLARKVDKFDELKAQNEKLIRYQKFLAKLAKDHGYHNLEYYEDKLFAFIENSLKHGICHCKDHIRKIEKMFDNCANEARKYIEKELEDNGRA
jgi:hypothetical protein